MMRPHVWAPAMTMRSRTRAATGYRKRRRLRWGAIAVAVLGALVGLLALLPNRNPAPEQFSNTPAARVKTPTKAPLSPEARHVAVRFVQTAVARHDLGEGWLLSGPHIRGGLTRAEFVTGNNGVIPYPVGQ
jgi:hypothetical protein